MDSTHEHRINALHRKLKIIIASMILGLVIYAVVAFCLRPVGLPPSIALFWSLLTITVASIPVYFLIGALSLRRFSDIVAALSTVTIIRGAIAEGVGLFAITTFLLSTNELCLPVAGLSLAGILAALPKRARLYTVLSDIHEERERSGLCLKCGYDLRGSKGRCPECGTEFEKS